MKHSFWKRFLALVMAIAIVLSTGVLDSAGWLLANNGEDTTQEPTGENTTPPSDQQGGSSTETLDLTTEPTVESTGATDPSEGGETEDETTESTPVKEVTLTVVIQSVYADESQEGAVLGTEYLTYAEGEASKTIAVSIPAVEGYTFAVSGAAMTLNAEGKYEASLSRPAESGMLYITVTYSPIVPEGEEGTEPETPAEGEETTEPETPVEGEETVTGPVVNVTVVYAYIGGVKEETSASYTVTFGEEETEKTFSLAVPQDPGYTYMLDTELDYVPAGDNTFVFTFARPEADTSAEICVFYAADTSVGSQDVYEPEDDATPAVDTYKFVVDGADYAEVKVIEGQTVLLPAAPQKDGYKFMGWFNGETEYAQAASVTGTEYTYTAKFEPGYYVFFLDEENRVKATKLLVENETLTLTNKEIVLDNKNLAITGWKNEAGEVVTSITMGKANVTLTPVLTSCFSVTYNTMGGTFMESDFYYGNEETVNPGNTATTRPGYTFDGWYTDDTYSTSFSWGNKLTESVTVYAKWSANQNTTYTVAYWIENANDNGYTFESSRQNQGATGSEIVLRNNANGYSKDNINSSYRAYFTFKEYDQGVTIAGDGSTIVNVYFSRNTYTVVFDIDGDTYWSRDPVVTIGGATYSDSYSFTAKYEEDISAKWPTASNVTTNPRYNGSTYYLYTIYGNNSSHTSKRVNLTKDLISNSANGSTLNFYFRWDNDRVTYHLHYMLQPVSGSTNKNDYIDSPTYNQVVTYNQSTGWGQKDIAGFTDESMSQNEDEGSDEDIDVYFYYTRNKYNLTFVNVSTQRTESGIYYEADISGKNFTPERPAGMDTVYKFQGWYTTKNCLAGSEFVWTNAKMPANNLILYAKWEAPKQDATVYFDIILENGSTSIKVPYGELLEDHLPEGKNSVADLVQLQSSDLTWDGQWLEVKDDGTFVAFFDINAPITRPVKIAPNITSNKSYSVTYDLNGGTGTTPVDGKAYYYGAYADVAYASGVTKADSVFLGWQAENGKIYQPGDEFQVSKNMTLTAVWGAVPKKVSVTHNSNYPAISGLTDTTYTTVEVTENNTTALATLNATGFTTPTGYRFGGWQNAAGKVFAEGASVLVTTSGDNTVYAVWIPLTYNVTYKYEGDVPTNADALPAGTEGVAYGSTFTAAGQPAAVEGYAFEGWKLNGSVVTSFTMPAGNVELVGTWTKLEYKVTYEYTGTVPAGAPEVPAQATVTMGKDYTVAADPEVDGYTFNGWLKDGKEVTSFEMPASNVTLIGSFSKRTDLGYIVKYVWGEQEIYSVQVIGTEDSPIVINGTYSVTAPDTYDDYTRNDDASKTVTITSEDPAKNVIVFEYLKDVTFTGETDTKTYNGEEQSITGIEVSGLKTDHTYTGLTYAAKGTNVDTYDGVFFGDVIIKDEKGNDVTKYYNVTKTPGTLTITKASLNLVITGNSDEKVYNGSEQEVTGFTSEGLQTGHKITDLTHVAKGTNVGEYTGSFTGTVKVMDGETDVTQNYAITQNPGKLTITRSSDWTLTVVGYDGVYDAQTHAVTVTPSVTEGTIIIYSIDGMAWTDTLPTITDVGEVRVKVRAENPNYTPLEEGAILTVTPAPLTIVTPDADKVYDGTALTAAGKIEGFVGGETATFTTTGSQTVVGSSDNTYTLTWDGTAKESNYTISETIGKLTVTEYAEEIVVTTTGGTFTYDGQAHGATVSVSTLPKGYTVHTAVSTSTATDVTTGEGVFATADQLVIVNAEGKVVTKQLKIKYVDGKIVINPRSVTLTSATDSKTYDGTPLTNDEITVGGDGFVEGEGANYNVTGTITDVGSADNAFTYTLKDGTKADNYKITVNFGKLTINKVTTEIVITAASDDKTYDGTALVNSGYTYTEGVLAEGDVLTAVVEGSQTDVGTADNVVTSYKVMRGDVDVTANYTFGASVDGTLEVTKRSVTLTSATDSKEYDGTPLTNATVTVTGDGFATGEGATYAVTGSQTLVGTSDNTFTYTLNEGTDASNYDIETVFGKLTVTDRTEKYKITVEANSGEFKYDGTEKTASGFKTLEFEVEGNTYTVEGLTASNAQTNAGTYTVEITGTAAVKDANGNDVTAQFTVTEVDGQLVITKRSVTLTSADDTKTYDGTALTNSKVTVSGDGFVTGEGATYDVTGSQLTVGSSENAFTYTLTEGTNADNYEIKTVFGTLTVINRDAKFEITVVANSGEFKYDGTEKNVSGFNTLTFTVNGQTYTVEGLSASNTQTDAGTYTVEITGTAAVKDAAGNDVTAQFKVTEIDGQLVITKRSVTLTSGDGEKVYDGTALTNSKVTVSGDGFAEGEGAEYSVTGTITNVGDVKNAFTYTLNEGTKAANYDITVVPGTLKITPVTDKVTVTITEHKGTEVYKGDAYTVSGYDVAISNPLYSELDIVFSGTASVSGTNVGTYDMELKPENFANINENFTNVEFVIVDGTLEITKRTVTLTSATDTKVYDGTALTNDTVTVTGDGFAEGEGATYDVTGTITYVGDVKNEFTYTLNEGTLADNYTITVAFGTLEITPVTDKVTVTITERSAVFTYDSTTKYAEGYDVSIDNALYTEADFVFDGFWMTAGLDAGVYKIYIEAEEFENINKNFTNVEFVIVDGTLTINKMPLKITAGSAEKEYDGTALTKDSYTATDLGERDRFDSVTVTGSITEVGTTDNVPSNAKILNGNDVDVTYNYDITYTNGTLEITQSTKELKVTANTASWTYDSEIHSDGGYTVTYGDESYTVAAGESATLSTGDKVTATITAQVKNVADTAEGNNEIVTLVVENADQYAKITEVDGTLTITQKDVTITADSNAKEYDGTALTDDGYTSTDLAEGDSYKSVTVTGSITEVGKVDNVPSDAIIMDGEDDVTANYNITYVNGQLEITASTKVLTVTANSNTWTYDSETHSDGGYTVTYGNESYTVAAGEFATLSTGDTVTATITKTVKNVADSGVNEIVTLVVDNADQYASIVEVDGTLTVTQKAVTITADSASREYNGTALTKDSYTSTDLAEGDSYKSVTVTGTITEVGSVDNVPSAAIIMDGEEDVTANYAITYVNGKLTITAMSAEVVVTITENSGEYLYDGDEHTVNGYEVTEISDPLYTVNDFTFSGDATVSGTDAGTYEMELKPEDFTNTSKNFAKVTFVIVDGDLEINKREVTMTSATDSKVYDGTALTNDTVTVTGDGFATGEGATYDVTGSQTEFGTSNNTFTYTLNEGTKADNYIIETVEGTLTVTASQKTVTVTITENSDTVMYDGAEHSVKGYEVTGISDPLYTADDFTFSGNATISGTDAGTYEMELKSDDFTNISANFADVEFVIVDGTLVIEKRNVTLTSATDSKVYDGTALTNSEVTVSGDGFAENEGATYDVTGTQTEFGTSSNSFTYTLNEGTKADNYIIKTVEGTLTVTAVTDKVTVVITENSGEYLYDGAEHSVKGYEVTSISNPLYTVDDFTFSGNAAVNAVDAGVYDMLLTSGDFTNKSPNFANVEFVIVDGQLTINKRNVTLTSASDSKEYDGIALTAKTVEITAGSFAPNEGYTVNITGSQTLVGKSDNTFSYALTQNTKSGNYEITVVYGELQVTDRTEPFAVVVEANSGEHVYDGQPFTVSGLKEATVARMAARIDGQIVTFLLNGETYTISGLHAERTETHVNPAAPTAVDVLPYSGYEVAITGTPVITDSEGNDVTKQFTVETISGLLTIHPAPVTMVSGDATKPYDGTELINHEVTATGFVEGEGAEYAVTGTQTLVGSSENAFTYTLNEGTQAQDYRIETTFGTLTVTAPEDYEIIDKTHTTETLYRLGDTVTFDITVKNIFSEEAKVVITEQEGVSILWNGQKVQSIETTIPAGETITLQAEYTLQEKDILAGEFTNVVDANIKATVDKIPYEGDDDDDDKVDEIEDPKAKLTLDKVTTSTPANGSKYVVGETITYQITATNSGNLTLHDVVIYDLLTGESQSKYAVETDPVEYTFELDVNLAPGESATVTYTHTVTEEDLGKNLINAVTGSAGNSSETDDEEKNDTPTEIIPDEVKDPTDDIRRDLDVEKNVLNYQDPYRLGSFIEYEIVVTNRGNVTERDVIVTDIVDSRGGAYYLSFTDLGDGLLLPGNRVQIPSIAPGETVTILCHYWIGADDEALPVNNKAVVESADGETGDEDDAETVMVEKLYTLTIYYLTDDWQTVLAPEYHDRYSVGYTYYVESPEIEGYEANYKAIWSGWDGMPEHDVVCYVLYSKLPEETTEPTTEPTDPSEETTEPTTAPTEPTYDLTEIPEEEVPLGDVDLGDHTCCIMHFLIMLVAMILLGFYTNDRKKYQERIHELKRSLAAEDAAGAAAGEEQA